MQMRRMQIIKSLLLVSVRTGNHSYRRITTIYRKHGLRSFFDILNLDFQTINRINHYECRLFFTFGDGSQCSPVSINTFWHDKPILTKSGKSFKTFANMITLAFTAAHRLLIIFLASDTYCETIAEDESITLVSNFNRVHFSR
jgi:hypothetical protein